MKAPNVILSGGGMKGAYQYGFFKRIYQLNPHFEVNKVYAVSVGSLNAIPIIAKKIDMLDKHWNHPTLMPFDTIAQDWETVSSEHQQYRNVQRIRAFLKKGSLYKSLNLKICYEIINNLSAENFEDVKKKLIVISYDTKKEQLVFDRIRTVEKAVQCIKSSSMFPGLFQIDSDQIDVYSNSCINFAPILKGNEKWLCLDLQGDMKKKNMFNTKNITIYSPELVNSPTLSTVSCLIVDRKILDDMIDEGQIDAERYLNSH